MNLIWKILIGLFILDVVKKQFEKPRGQVVKNEDLKSNSQPAEGYQSNQDETDDGEEFPDNIDTSLDEEDKSNGKEKGQDKVKKIKKKKTKIEDDDNDDVTEEEDKQPKLKRQKSKKKTITVSYCKTTYLKYFDQFKLEMMGNFTKYEFVGVEHPLSPQKQFFSKFTFFSQIGVSILIFSGGKAKPYLPFIPGELFDQMEKNKWMVMIGNYFLHSYLKSYLSSSYAFEVSIEGINLWSKFATNTLPKVEDIRRILKEKGI